ncbi:MAG: T9SS type A sorting domain-containing protein [Candidatus Goldbacteria bacterium]|nr:T9SS type A sorting domain-containing protein [Candidatus Goldiibacteriota bacterium]
MPLHLDKINEIHWSFIAEGQDYDFYMDDIQVYSFNVFASPTPTVTPTGISAMLDLNKVYVYPSLINMSCATCTGITFYGLTAHTKVRIYNLSGEQVYSAEAKTPGGTFFVKLRKNRKTSNLAPGIYIYVVFDGENNHKTGKFAIVR